MKIKYANANSCSLCLQSSLSVDNMLRFAQMVIPKYDIYERLGLKEGTSIFYQNVAEQIVTDMIKGGFYIDFVENLVRIDREGLMGRSYEFKGLDIVVDGLINEGYSYDNVSGLFYENQEESISPSWGRLKEGDEQRIALLRLDIAGNSELVRSNPRPKIEKAYNDIRNIINKAVISRLGRIWSREGDGAVAAFLFGSIEKMAVYAGIEILQEMFFYNRLQNPLDTPINIRLGAHIGQVSYSENEVERLKNDTVKQAFVYESLAASNALCVSYNLYITMDKIVLELFGDEKTGKGCKYRLYKIGIEK
ncbi:MAG: hypothetical protein FWG77_05565 [Treponema sp.]|nr:hypothetical protein [Treponema sp.]